MKRIETLEDLSAYLAEPYYEFGWSDKLTTCERVAWHLALHLPFDLDIILKGTRTWDDDINREDGDFAIELDKRYGTAFSFDNQELAQWLFSTPLETLAAHTSLVIRREELNKVENYYDAAQDYYADNWYDWEQYRDGEITGREYIGRLKEHVDTVERHVAEGRQLGLTMDEIVLHDCTWGLLPRMFDPDMIAASKDMLLEAGRELPQRPYIWSERGKEDYAPKMLAYAARRLQEAGVDIGYGSEYTVEQGYLLNYFSRLYWREAAARPKE